jgi:hypothetical protein
MKSGVVVKMPGMWVGPCPTDGFFGTDVKSIGIKQGALIMVAKQDQAAAVADQFHALAGIRAVADDVAEAEDRVHLLAVDIFEDSPKCLEVAMDVAEYGPLH